jgi:hypothetical protein
MEKNPYLILEVSHLATRKEIVEAYRRLARKYHPDINKSPAAESRMREINWAYAILSDPVKRTSINRKHRTYRAQWKSHYGQSGQASAKPRTSCQAQHRTSKSKEKTWSFTRQESSRGSISIGGPNPVIVLILIAGTPILLLFSIKVSPVMGIILLIFIGSLLYAFRGFSLGAQLITIFGGIAPFLCIAYGFLSQSLSDSLNTSLYIGTLVCLLVIFSITTLIHRLRKR